MTSTTEEFDFEETIDESSTKDKYYRVEEHLKEVHFKIVDYLAQEGRRDLFMDLTLTDVAAMIYDPVYLREIVKNRSDVLF
jgi:type VI protein secretion system component Hcp